MPRSEEQNKEIRNESRDKILNSAIELFANEGFHTSTISKIAKKAGVSKGLIYNYFESKDDLLKTIVYKGMSSMMEYFDTNKDGYLTDEEFDFYIDGSFEIFEKNKKFWKLYFSLVTQPFAQKYLQEVYQNIMENYLKVIVDYYARHGSDNPEIDALIFGATLDGIGFNYILNSDFFPVEPVKEMLKRKFKYPNNIKK